MSDKHLSFHSGRDTHVVINEVAREFPEVASALNRLDAKVLRDFSDALSSKMNWAMAEMFSQAANGLSMDILEGFASTAHLVDSRRLDDFSRAVTHLESDQSMTNLEHVVDDLGEVLSLVTEAKKGLIEAKNSLITLDAVVLAGEYRKQQEQSGRQHSSELKQLKQELHDWKVRCMYAIGAAMAAFILFIR